MILVIGGYAQGKLQTVTGKLGEKYLLADGGMPETELLEISESGWIVVNHFHLWVRKCLEEKRMPENEVKLFLEQHSRVIIISDEIGNGIVPLDPFEREYRERTGRILVELAKEAEQVVRVTCGIEQRIK